MVKSRKNYLTDPDPWDARTLEWGTTSPPPAHNYDFDPTVTHLDEWWHRKYETDDRGKLKRRASVEYLADVDFDASSVHLPSPSYWPIIVAAGLPLVAYGLIFTYWLAGVGGVMVLGGIFGWGLEPSVDPDAGHARHDDGGHEPPSPEAVTPEAVTVGAEEHA